jgi:hypothetical protein
MSEQPETYRTAYLPPDIARCPGVGYPDEDTGEMGWREGCERCLRRLAPAPEGVDVMQMQPPELIVFWCPWYIGPDPGDDIE